MHDVAKFLAEAEKAIRALESTSGVGVRFKTNASDGSLWNDGFVSALTLWSDGLVKVGLLATPGTAPVEWRGIIATGGQAVTLSPDARLIVPKYLLARFVADNASGLKKLSANWQRALPLLADLHEALGGSGGTLKAVGEVVEDTPRHAAFSGEKVEASMSPLVRRLDGSSSFGGFADWLDAAIKGDTRPPTIAKLAPWDRLCLCWIAKSGGLDELGIADQSSQSVIEALPGLDAGPPARPTWKIWPGMTSGEATIIRLAERSAEVALDHDDAYGRIVAAINEQSFDYDGVAHAEATAQIAEAGDAPRAFATLTAAAWWMSRRHGKPPDAIYDGVRKLCDDNGWDALRWVAEHEKATAK